MNKKISIIGGDLRQLKLAEILSLNDYEVTVCGFGDDSISEKYATQNDIKKAADAKIIILPMPVSQDLKTLNAPFNKEKINLSDIAQYVPDDAIILGGRMNDDIINTFGNKKCIDYSEREELMIKNAVPTAEGAIELAIAETPITLAKSKALIIGYGRIGKVLSRLLSGLGVFVSVSARKYSDLAWIDVNGYNAIHNKDIIKSVQSYDIIFNTAPALILDEKILSKINPDTVVIDLASKPGGVDFQKAKDFGLKVIWALSLPGKTAPLTSGEIIAETVLNILYEEGV